MNRPGKRIDVLALGGEVDAYRGPATLTEIFKRQVRRTPHHVAVEDATGKRGLTYAELDAAAERLAGRLREDYRFEADVCVGLAAERTLETIVSLLAILKAGGAYVPLGPGLPETRLRFMVETVSPAVILCSAGCAGSFTGIGAVPVLTIGSDDIESDISIQRDGPVPHTAPNGNDLAHVIFTSGTTGAPKGVMVPHIAVAQYIDAMAAIEAPRPDDRVLQIMELTFDSSIFDLWMAWGFGGTVVLCEPWTALEGLGDFIRSRSITCLGCTPTQLGVMSPEEVPGLRIAAIGGEIVPPTLIEEWGRHPTCRIFNQYGPTEATVTVTSVRCTADMPYPKSIGYANPGSVKLYILDAAGQPSPLGVPGGFCIAGPQLARGYLGQPELTAEEFIPNPFATSEDIARLYRTGDQCRWLADGSVEYLGRIDSQVKLRGFRVELEEIEHHIRDFGGVRACSVALRERDEPARGSFLCAYLVLSQASGVVDLPGLRSHLAAALPDHMVPAAFVTVDAIPTDASGKAERRALPPPESHHFVVAEKRVPPPETKSLNPVQGELLSMFADVLGIEKQQVGLSNSFFNLGGNSLTAARLLGLVRQQFSTRIRFADFFANPNVLHLAARIEAGSGSDGMEIALTARDRNGDPRLPLSSAQGRMYFLHQLEPDSSVYNICGSYDLRGGEVDACRLESAFRVVIDRHEILRSYYRSHEAGLFQIVGDGTGFRLARLDLSKAEDEQERSRDCDQAIEADGSKPFSLGLPGSLPIRALLVRLDPRHSRLAITVHHSATDGLSWEILCRELSAAYVEDPLPPLAVQYADFCLWEAAFMQSETYREQLAYWRDHLGPAPETLELPGDRPRPAVRSGAGASSGRRLKGLSRPLRKAAAAHSATPFALLLAAYFFLLHRLSGQSTIIVGILSPGRSQLATDSIIGMFVNTLPIRIELDPSQNFAILLERVTQATSHAFDHQQVPFGEIVRHLVHAREQGQTPLVQTMLTMDEYDETDACDLEFGGLEICEIEGGDVTTSMFDFSIGCSLDSGPDLTLEAEFDTDLFDQTSIDGMLEQFESILRVALVEPDTPLAVADTGTSETNETLMPASVSEVRPLLAAAADDFVEPRTTEEVRLAAMFCEVLGLPRVGIDDSFFSLGGDSLLSFRLIALARKFGYLLRVTHILEHQTVARLAGFLRSAAALQPEAEAPLAEVPVGQIALTPIQRWFFEEQFPEPSHYNQSRMYSLPVGIDDAMVREALLGLIRHHDALRLSYEPVGAGVPMQRHNGVDSAANFLRFRVVDLSSSSRDELATKIERETERCQSALDIEREPLLSALLIGRPHPMPPALFLVIHHLAVDEVSWGVIADDLELILAQLVAGDSLELPAKSHAFSQWSYALERFASSGALDGEIEYWRNAEASPFALPAACHPHGDDRNVKSIEDGMSSSFSVSGIEGLPVGCAVHDLLVAALAWSLAKWEDGADDVCILLEGHGREAVVAEGFDLSRTVGWFTSVYPVRFDFTDIPDAGAAIGAARTQLEKIPHNGIGFGLLKYPFSGASPLSSQHASPVSFNYLGRWDTAVGSDQATVETAGNTTPAILVEEDDLPCGSDWSALNLSDDSILDVSCHLAGDRLEVDWRFDSRVVKRSSVKRLVESFSKNVAAMVAAVERGKARLAQSPRASVRDAGQRAIAAVWEKHRRHDSFHGLAASVVVNGEFAFVDAHGFRDESRVVAVDEHTRFSLGSVGKPFVSLLAAVLADEGIIDLDESLGATLSALDSPLPEVYGQMTLRQLLCMTAGIPYVDTSVEEKVDDIFEICRSQIEIEHPPGSRYFYSNFSYALAGYIMALRTGVTNFERLPGRFLELLQDKVFNAVGMNDAEPEGWQFLASDAEKLGLDHQRDAIGSAAMLPSGAVKASATDTARFLISEFNRGVAMSGRRVASAERVAERFDINHSLGYDWGMGWFFDRTHDFLHISGQWADAVSGFRLDPVTGLGLSYMLSVRDSVHWQFMEMDMDRVFIELQEVARS